MDAYLPSPNAVNNAQWKEARKRAIASKDPVCAICGKWIDITLPVKDPKTGAFNVLSVEVDHIVPRARGGDMYSLDNLQLTHSKCNRRKGARMDSDYLPETVVNPVPISNPW